MYGEGRPRLDLEYPVYRTHELADEEAFTSVVILTASFPSGFLPRPGFEPTTFSLGEVKLITDLRRPAKP